jgi:hypothetical protein
MTHVNEVILGTLSELSIVYPNIGIVFSLPPNWDVYDRHKFSQEAMRSLLDAHLTVAALHDVFEDCARADIDATLEYVTRGKHQMFPFFDELKNSLTAISKRLSPTSPKNYTNYADYVRRVAENKIARIVKIADLKHNLSDLESGNLKEKYQLTLAVLESHTDSE